MMRAAAVVVVFATALVHAQTPQQPAFEVASVKRNTSGDTMTFYQMPPRGLFNITNATLRTIITQAYEILPHMERFVLVAPSNNSLMRGNDPLEQRSEPRFDIRAKPPDEAAPGTQKAMLRTLLEDRFKLRVHREKRDLPVYALTVVREGRLGPSLRASTIDCNAFAAERRKNPALQSPLGADGGPVCMGPMDFSTPGQLTLRSVGPIKDLGAGLQSFVDRPVVDNSGLTGTFEWTFVFKTLLGGDDMQTVVFREVQNQLGLKLERSTAPYEVLVVDSVEMPTEN